MVKRVLLGTKEEFITKELTGCVLRELILFCKACVQTSVLNLLCESEENSYRGVTGWLSVVHAHSVSHPYNT